MSDAVPPPAATAFYDPSGLSRRSSAYNLLLHALKPEGGSDLPQALGDMYAKWIAYRDADTSSLTQQQLFERWADRNLNPGQVARAINVFKQQTTMPLNQALDAFADKNNQQTFVNPAGNSFNLFVYSANTDNAAAAIATGGSATINFDSQTMNTSLDHIWVKGSASGLYDIFSGGVGGSFDQLNTKAASSRLTVVGNIGAFATLATTAGGWFTSAEVSRAYNAKNDNTVWDPLSAAGNWDSLFAQPNGALARRITQLVLVSDYDLTVTSHATYNQSDATKITAEASVGIWPFFSGTVSTSQTHSTTLNQDGSLSVHHHLDKGRIQIWGATVELAPA